MFTSDGLGLVILVLVLQIWSFYITADSSDLQVSWWSRETCYWQCTNYLAMAKMTQCRAVWLLGSTTVNIPLQFLDDFQNLMAISLSKSPELFSRRCDRIQLYVKLQTQASTPPGQPGTLPRYTRRDIGENIVFWLQYLLGAYSLISEVQVQQSH